MVIEINGESMKVEDIVKIAKNFENISIAGNSKEKIKKSRNVNGVEVIELE